MDIPQYKFDSGIRLFNIGDVHRGDASCDADLLHKVIAEIENDPDAWWVSTGDLLNTAMRGMKHDSIHDSLTLREEYKLLKQELLPIAEKCLGVVSSNHTGRVRDLTSLDLDEVFCGELGVPYLGDLGLINITCQRTSYFVAMHHGVGGGKGKGGKINGLEDMERIVPGADVYLTGHTHQYMAFINDNAYIDRKRNLLSYHKAWFCTTGHFLNWDGSYAQRLKLRPAPKGAAVALLASSMSGVSANKDVTFSLFS